MSLLRQLENPELRIPELEALWLNLNGPEEIRGNHGKRTAREALRVLDLLPDDAVWRALWWIKREARDGAVDESVLFGLAERAPGFREWRARLTLCQLFAITGCPAQSGEWLVPWLEECFGDRRVIVRAWAVSAFWHFRGDKRYRGGWKRMFAAASSDPAPSMRARLRRLEKQAGTK